MKKDPAVELMRIIGCIIVIGVHSNLYGAIEMGKGASLISCWLADGVAIFWMISGFFMFKNFDYHKVMKRTLQNIVIPLIIVSIVTFYFINDVIAGNKIHIFSHSSDEYVHIIKNLIQWYGPIDTLFPLWYLYVYIFLMICSPVIYAFIGYLDQKKQRVIIFLILSLLFFIWNDISNNTMACFDHHTITGMFPAALQMIWGYYIYKYRKKIKNAWYAIAAVFGFFALNAVRSRIRFYRYSEGILSDQINIWYTSIGLLCACCVFIFCYIIVRKNSSIMNKCICFFASHTFNIYLIHALVLAFIDRYLLRCRIQDWMYNIVGNGFAGKILTMAINVIIIGGISLCISIIIHIIKKYVCRIVHLSRERRAC